MTSNNGSDGSPKAARPKGAPSISNAAPPKGGSATTKNTQEDASQKGVVPNDGALNKGGAPKKGASPKRGGPRGGAPQGGAPKAGAPKSSPPKVAAPPKSRLAAKVNGAFLDDEAARQMWVEFSAHMDAHENDFDGFARSKGFASAKPEHQEGRAVLVLSR